MSLFTFFQCLTASAGFIFAGIAIVYAIAFTHTKRPLPGFFALLGIVLGLYAGATYWFAGTPMAATELFTKIFGNAMLAGLLAFTIPVALVAIPVLIGMKLSPDVRKQILS